MTYRVTLVYEGDDGRIKTSVEGHHKTQKKAMSEAKRVAGRAAKFVRKGDSIMYIGPNGAAYIT
jgi:hypothetical protein